MIVGWREGVKLFGIAIVCACAVLVCTFFLNYYMDALKMRSAVTGEAVALFEAQLLTAKLVSLISGGCLSLISAVLVAFYVKLYIGAHASQLGVLKALGFPDRRIALGFWVFGLSVFLGCAVGFGGGFALMPIIYTKMSENMFALDIHFHAELLFGLVFAPAVVFAALAILCAYLKLRMPALQLLRGEEKGTKAADGREAKPRPFLTEMRRTTLKSKKSLVFFIAFAAFCYGSMLQMAFYMSDYSSVTMGVIIFLIGAVLAVTCFLLAVTVLARANRKSVALMRAYGFDFWECGRAVFGGYRIPALIGFGIGTAYEYALMKLMIGLIFADVIYDMPALTFRWGTFFGVLLSFLVLYEAVMLFFAWKLGKTSVRAFVLE